ncbi:DNA-binding protein RFX5-like, partial [Daphnia magna]|uniref:DNA-binding protein RFX5-like n=1 Tax=Daphnia magna TaxID=35525 RepID=UPI001E1BAF8C
MFCSMASKKIVSNLLLEVDKLSDTERLLLYYKLPLGRSTDIDPLRMPLNPLGSRPEIMQTVVRIQTHLEEDVEVSLPKQEVYEEYGAYCTENVIKPFSTADFGKVMKQVFPNVISQYKV